MNSSKCYVLPNPRRAVAEEVGVALAARVAAPTSFLLLRLRRRRAVSASQSQLALAPHGASVSTHRGFKGTISGDLS